MEEQSFDEFKEKIRYFNFLENDKGEEPVLGYLTRLAADQADEQYLRYFELLLKSGSNPNVCDSMGRTPLLNLARNDQLKCVKLFEKYGADINFHALNGFTPLQEALRVNYALSVSKYFLEHPSTNLHPDYCEALLSSTRRANARQSLALLQKYGIQNK
jgi:ankyrin repeat protein